MAQARTTMTGIRSGCLARMEALDAFRCSSVCSSLYGRSGIPGALETVERSLAADPSSQKEAERQLSVGRSRVFIFQ